MQGGYRVHRSCMQNHIYRNWDTFILRNPPNLEAAPDTQFKILLFSPESYAILYIKGLGFAINPTVSPPPVVARSFGGLWRQLACPGDCFKQGLKFALRVFRVTV